MKKIGSRLRTRGAARGPMGLVMRLTGPGLTPPVREAEETVFAETLKSGSMSAPMPVRGVRNRLYEARHTIHGRAA